jgi:coenzyme F420-0:L-glutamate ligase/coenzyme F420-1:gamma-L-glutamate ligase
MRLEILPVTGIGDVRPGDDLAAVIAGAAPWLVDGDVLVVTSKIVSKAEGRLVPVPVDGPAREAARAALLVQETARTVARRGPIQIVQTRHGFVMANAGIDASNVDSAYLVLLPVDPDASARALRAALRTRAGLDVAIVVSDTMGRPWRIGLTDVALGAAGIEAIRDYRGERDAYGNELFVTEVATVDELCAAAELVKNKYDQVPVAVVRGLGVTGMPDGPGASVLLRDAAHDLFALGTDEARADGQRALAVPSTVDIVAVPLDGAALSRALDLVASPFLRFLDAGTRDKLRDEFPNLPGGELVLASAEPRPAAVFRAGGDAQRLCAALAAEGLAAAWREVDPDRLAALVASAPGAVPLGLLAVGVRPAAGRPGP